MRLGSEAVREARRAWKARWPAPRVESRAVTSFLFGASSMIGWSMYQARGRTHVTPFVNSSTRLAAPLDGELDRGIDLDDERAVADLFRHTQPDLIIHCAGVCDVETCEKSPEFAHTVNVEGTRILLDHAPAHARLVYCSSDHVFSGDTGPYREDSPTDPVSIYGKTRVAAEQLVLRRPGSLIVRPGLWIGPSATGKLGHLDWLRYRHRRGLPMTVVADEARSAMWANDAAHRMWELARSPITGIRHLVATRAVARPELARFLDKELAIGAHIAVHTRRDRRVPHLGVVELQTIYADELATPLPSVVEQRQSV
jgi:dTDP-4-dehydrorhamnose reductase